MEYLVLGKIYNWIWWHHGSMLEFTDLLFVDAACMPASSYTPLAMEVTGTPEFNYFYRRVNTFDYIVFNNFETMCRPIFYFFYFYERCPMHLNWCDHGS